MKRYIENSRAKEWALFYLSIKNHSANELLFGISNYSKYSLSEDFEKLKTWLLIPPNQRSQENLREIQLYLKKNRAFHSLPKEVQLQLCQTAIYQEFEAGSMLLRQGHVPLECYLILAGQLKVMSSNTSMNRNTNSEILSEFEEGDFIGEACLLTNANRPALVFCKTDVKVLVISKEVLERLLSCSLGKAEVKTSIGLFWAESPVQLFSWQESLRSVIRETGGSRFLPRNIYYYWRGHKDCLFTSTVGFLLYSCTECTRTISRNMQLSREPPIILLMAKEKIDFLVHCSLRRYYRAGTTIISDNLNSHFLVFIVSGRCRIIAQMNYEEISVRSCVMKTGSSTRKNVHTLLPPKGTPAVTGRSLETSTVSPKTSFSAARKKTLDTKKPPFQASSSATCFVEIRVLEQDDVFISEGAECVFVPKSLFLAEAGPEFRRTAVELGCAYPTEEDIREYLVERRAWNEYKARLVAQQLKTGS